MLLYPQLNVCILLLWHLIILFGRVYNNCAKELFVYMSLLGDYKLHDSMTYFSVYSIADVH